MAQVNHHTILATDLPNLRTQLYVNSVVNIHFCIFFNHDSNSIALGSVYTKRQCQRCDNSAIPLAIILLKTMESLENGLQSNSGATPLYSMLQR